MTVCRLSAAVAIACLAAVPVYAQSAPAVAPAPAPIWTGSVGFGLALTSGNSDTSSINVSFKAVRNPKKRVVFNTEGLYIRGTGNGRLTADNAMFGAKVGWTFSDRAYAFGQFQYLRDSFKAIEYFVAPTTGVGYKWVNSARATLATDLAVGPSWEKNREPGVKSKVAVAIGEKASVELTRTATLTQAFAAAIIADDWSDDLYTFRVGIAASLSNRIQLKVEAIDTFRNKPPSVDIQENDVSTLMSVIYKF